LFVLEAKYTSHGVLLVGGIVAMVLGALFLVRSPLTAGGVSLGIAFAVTLPFALISVILTRLVLRSRKWKPQTGVEGMIGQLGTVVGAISAGAEGMVRVHSELWRASAAEAIPEGTAVRVVRVLGLKVVVEPAAEADSKKV
jgi:membrane-bound serine protease (ClpP class)